MSIVPCNLTSNFNFDLFTKVEISNGIDDFCSLQNLHIPGPICIDINACKIAANATGGGEKYCMDPSTIKYDTRTLELNENDETFSNMVFRLTAFYWWYKILLHTKLSIIRKSFQQLKTRITARWQTIRWTNLSITYMCMISFVICAGTCTMLMPGIFSDTFSKFVQLVWTGVSLPVECVVLGAIYPPLKYHNRHRDRGDPIECRGMGSMVRHCICKIDFAFGTLITVLQKKATYVVLVNGIATYCGLETWWIEDNPTTLKKMKLVTIKCGIRRKSNRKKSYHTGFSPLLVLVGMLLVMSAMSVATADRKCTPCATNFWEYLVLFAQSLRRLPDQQPACFV